MKDNANTKTELLEVMELSQTHFGRGQIGLSCKQKHSIECIQTFQDHCLSCNEAESVTPCFPHIPLFKLTTNKAFYCKDLLGSYVHPQQLTINILHDESKQYTCMQLKPTIQEFTTDFG